MYTTGASRFWLFLHIVLIASPGAIVSTLTIFCETEQSVKNDAKVSPKNASAEWPWDVSLGDSMHRIETSYNGCQLLCKPCKEVSRCLRIQCDTDHVTADPLGVVGEVEAHSELSSGELIDRQLHLICILIQGHRQDFLDIPQRNDSRIYGVNNYYYLGVC